MKEKMEKFMDTERDVYADEYQAKKNGYYERKLLTRWGLIEDLRVPGTRDGEFYPSLLIPYHRTWHLEDIIINLYSGGMSLEEIEKSNPITCSHIENYPCNPRRCTGMEK